MSGSPMPIQLGTDIDAIEEPGSISEDMKCSGEKTWVQSLDMSWVLKSVGAALVNTVRKLSATVHD